MVNDPNKLTWQAPEFEHRPKTSTWYWVTIILAIILLALAIWQRNYVFGVFIVIAELMVLVWGSSEPPMIEFSLDSKGLTIGGTKFYPFHDIKSWSADSQGFFDPAWPDIFLHLHSHFHIGLRIKVPKAILEDVEAELREQVPEVPFRPSAIDTLEKFLGF